MSQHFACGGQSIGVSALTSVFPMKTQDWSPLGWTVWISLQSKGLWRVFSNITVQKHQFFGAQFSSQSNFHIHTFSSVQSLSHVRLFVTPWIAARQASLSITISRSLLKLTSIESVMPSNQLILYRPLLLLSPIPPSIRVFSNESTLLTKWPKYWSFSFKISLSNEYSGLISFRMDWFNLLAVQGALKSLLQHHSLKASILQCSAFLFSSSHVHTWLEKP